MNTAACISIPILCLNSFVYAASGLVAAYSFNEGFGSTVADASGNGNTGTISGAAWTTSGRYGSALSFNGTNAWVTVNDAAALDLTAAVTLESWVNPSVVTNWQAVVIKERPGGLSYAIYANSSNNRPAAALHTSTDINLYGASPLPANTWSHLAITYDSANLRLYVNGVQVSVQAVSGAMPTSTSPLRIGGDSVWGEYFKGLIDEVRIYNRALSAAEIQTDMNTAIISAAQTGAGVSPANFTLTAAGATQQLTTTATYSDGSTQNVTNNATYSSSNTAVATVSATGLVKVVSNGTSTITATYGGFSATSAATVNIAAAVQNGLTVTPVSITLAPGASQQLTVTATYSDGATQNVTTNSATSYSSSSAAVATVNATGQVKAVANGTASITASYGSFSAIATVTVNSTPPPAGLVAAYSFNEGAGSSVADASGNGNIGTISGATWTASGRYGNALSFNGTNSWITVNDAASLDLTNGVTLEAWVNPTTPTNWQAVIVKERSGGLSYAVYASSDTNRPVAALHTTTDVNLYAVSQLLANTWTHLAMTYNGSNLVLYVNGVQSASQGLAGAMAVSTSPLRIGGDSVWGEYFKGLIDEVRIYNRALSAAEIQNDMNAPINSAPQTGLTLAPGTFTISTSGGMQQLTATATYSDGSTQNVTANSATTYASSNTAVVTVNTSGQVKAVANGTATVTATYGGLSASSTATVSVAPPVQNGITVTPAAFTVAPAGTQQLTVTATYSDGSTQNVTTNAATTYTSSNPAAATVNTTGQVKGVATGTATITASFGGFAGSATATVSSTPPPTGLVAAYNFNEGAGTTVADASGNGNTGTISGATWTSAGRYGGALSFNGANAWVTINDASSLHLTTALTLEAWVNPQALSGWQAALVKESTGDLVYSIYVNTGDNQAAGTLNVRGTDVTVNDPSADAQVPMNTWTHLAVTFDGSTLRLYINGFLINSVANAGQLTTSSGALRIGGDSIWGEYFNGIIDEIRIYNRALSAAEIQTDMYTPVNPPALSAVTLSPAAFTIPVARATQQLTLTGSYGSLSQDVTLNAGVTYSSSNTAVATVGLTGLVTGVANGTATITASYRGLTQTATATVAITTDPAQVGQWSQSFDVGVVAVNLLLMRTGKVLLYGGQVTSGKDARVLDPATNATVAAPNNFTDLFCSGHSALPDGRILVVGGYDATNNITGTADVNIFNPTTQQWTSAPKMSYRRWYPTATVLSDGRVLVTSGAQTCYAYDCLATTPEIYNPATNTWTKLTAAQLPFWYYPFTFLLADGRVLLAGTSEQPTPTRVLNVATQSWTMVDPVPVNGGSAVMYTPGKIMKSGTASDAGAPNIPASNRTYVLDTNQPSPAWQETAPMAAGRAYHVLTMLPDGSVLATGGESTLDGSTVANAVYQAELWSPATQTWTTLALGPTPRMYHSTAILMPDARVLVSGGCSLYPAQDYPSAEYYSPPYLFKGSRPAITSAPSNIAYGGAFNVQSPDAMNIASIALIRLGATTHQFNQEQVFRKLTFQASAGVLTVQAPASGSIAPPGYYMLFVVNTNGVPSVAQIVQLQ